MMTMTKKVNEKMTRKMNKTALKIFLCFALAAAIIATILLVVNFLGFAFIASDTRTGICGNNPQGILDKLSEQVSANMEDIGDGFALPEDSDLLDGYWCILIDESGEVIWSDNQPADVPSHYSLNDIAKMTRWFLQDYPVYVRTLDNVAANASENAGSEHECLLVLGMPKNAVGKYDMEYSMEWFDTLPQRLLAVLMLNLCLAALLALLAGNGLYRRLCAMINGMNDLRLERRVRLRERGIFRELAKSINDASAALERKNEALAARDDARSNWISGISHDIRTPLAVIMGYSEELAACEDVTGENRRKAETITRQSVKIKKLINDLNLISSLEYDMQPAKKSNVPICPLLRRVAADIMNGEAANVEIVPDLQDEKATVLADESLLERAVFNLLHNSAVHNPEGCIIRISEQADSASVYLEIADNGRGVPQEVLAHIGDMPKSAHGLGLPLAYRIIRVHGGKFAAANDDGFVVRIELPRGE
jgi:signal transduction histidine kinase